MSTRCKALRKPTEQPIEQWYASLIGKVPTKYLLKGYGYGFQKMRKGTLCALGGKETQRNNATTELTQPKINAAARGREKP
jgi:hypothetical protein